MRKSKTILAGMAGGGAALGLLQWAWPPIATRIGSTKDVVDIATMLGTWAAVVVALYIASSDRRNRAAETKAIAQLTAASLAYRLQILRDAVDDARKFAEARLQGDLFPAHFLVYASSLQVTQKCSFEELQHLASIDATSSMQIAAAQDKIEVARGLLERESISMLSTADEQTKALGIVVSALSEAGSLLSPAILACERESRIALASAARTVSKSP